MVSVRSKASGRLVGPVRSSTCARHGHLGNTATRRRRTRQAPDPMGRNRPVDASNAATAFKAVLTGDGVRKVSAAAVSRWGQILLLEDDSARAVRRGSTGVAERSAEVLVRAHAIDENGVRVVGSRSYVPGRSRENGGLLRTDLALELVEQHAASGSVVVCGSSYGAVPAFLQQLCSTDIDAVVEIRPSTRVHVERTGSVQSKQTASGLLDKARWRRVPIGVPGLDEQALVYAATRLGTGSVGNGPRGMLFAALTGAIDGVHRGTVLGFSSDTEASVVELLQAVGWSRWIRPLVRRAERNSPLAASARENRTGANGVRPPLRANIKLSRLHDARAFADATDPDAPRLRGSLRSGNQSINVVELFAGAGGMGLGFLLAETKDAAPAFRLIYSGEVDPIYVRTLSVNHAAYGRLRPGAVPFVPAQLSPDDLRDRRTLQRVQSRGQDAGGVDVVIGGPPCQGFSNANRNSWRSDNPHNQLVDVYLTYIRRLQPKVFLLENVQGIHWTPKPASSRDANVLDHVSERMAKAGYDVFVKLLDAVWYGVPQYRSRFFVLGIHRDLGYVRDDFGEWGPFPLPSHGAAEGRKLVTVRQAIGDLPKIGNGHAIDEMLYAEPFSADNGFLQFVRAGSEQNALTDHVTSRHADYVIERYRRIPPGGNWESIVDSLTNYADVKRTHSNIYRRLRWNEPSITIGHYRKSMLVHPAQHRGLSLREAARLQSFPDWFRFAGTTDGGSGGLVHKQQQLANAVCPLVTKAIAELILGL